MIRAAVALFALTLIGCKSTPQGARVDPALSTVVPSDIVMLASIQVEELMKTPIYKNHLASVAIGPVDEFAKETGLDLRNNVWEVLFMTDGKRGAALGRGKFSEGEAEPRLQKPGAQRFGYKGYTFIGNDEEAAMFLSPTVAGYGDTALLKRVVDARDESNGPPKVLADRMKQIPHDAEIWMVFSGALPILPPGAGKGAPIERVMQSVESGAVHLDFSTGLGGLVTTTSGTDQTAKELHDAVKGMLGLAQMMAKGNEDLPKLLSGLQLTQEGKVVNMRVQLADDSVPQIMRLLP
jgi:hypothetical protein